jgi:hypothetical protein
MDTAAWWSLSPPVLVYLIDSKIILEFCRRASPQNLRYSHSLSSRHEIRRADQLVQVDLMRVRKIGYQGEQNGLSKRRSMRFCALNGAGRCEPYDALDKLAGDLRATHPHFVYTRHGEPQVLHNSARLAWGSRPKGKTPAYTGIDFIIVHDGKIAALYVYLDSSPT